ncbi:MAG: hypothetical protein ACYC2P_06475 [Paludibacteraceae bacterium]
MLTNFITIRLDRLKYPDLKSLYSGILAVIAQTDAGSIHLSVPFRRFTERSALLASLDAKDRTKYHKAEYDKHLRRLDNLVSALLLHVKALKRADFPEIRYEVDELNRLFRKELGNFVHVGAANKKAALDTILWYLRPVDDKLPEIVVKPGLSRYLEELRNTREKLTITEQSEQGIKEGQAKSQEAIKAKAELIKELRLLLQYIDAAVISYPEVDYAPLTAGINYELKIHRMQLRNLQTRRIRKKEKELKLPPVNDGKAQKPNNLSD